MCLNIVSPLGAIFTLIILRENSARRSPTYTIRYGICGRDVNVSLRAVIERHGLERGTNEAKSLFSLYCGDL